MAFPQLRRYRAFSGTSEKHRSIFCGDILVVMSMAHRLTCKKLRVLSRLRRSQPAPNIRNPAPLRTHWCPCVASSSCLALRKCPQMPERARHLRPLSSLLLTYLWPWASAHKHVRFPNRCFTVSEYIFSGPHIFSPVRADIPESNIRSPLYSVRFPGVRSFPACPARSRCGPAVCPEGPLP